MNDVGSDRYTNEGQNLPVAGIALFAGDGDPLRTEILKNRVAARSNLDLVSGEKGGQEHGDAHDRAAPLTRAEQVASRTTLLDQLGWTAYLRNMHVRMEGNLTRQVKAVCRRLCAGDKEAGAAMAEALGKPGADLLASEACREMLEARSLAEKRRAALEKELLKLAKKLPAYSWVLKTRGLGAMSFAMIVAETGDLTLYANPAKVWKRMGLAVIGGEAQGRRTDLAEALAHGYQPRRRSVMHVVGECLLRSKGPYKAIYDVRKVIELEKLAGDKAVKIRAHKRAMRVAEKRLLQDLWHQWRCESDGRVAATLTIPETYRAV